MNKLLQPFQKDFLKILIIDFITIGIVGTAWYQFGLYLQSKSFEITQGMTALDFQQMMQHATANQMEFFVGNLRSFVLTFFIGSIIVIILTLLFYSLGQAKIWYTIRNKRLTHNNFWRWVWLQLVIGLFFFVFSIPFLMFTTIPLQSTASQYIGGLILLFYCVLFLHLVMNIRNSFTKSYRIWDSVAKAFSSFKKKGWFLLSSTGIFAVVSILFTLVQKWFVFYQTAFFILYGAAIILFINWFRLQVSE